MDLIKFDIFESLFWKGKNLSIESVTDKLRSLLCRIKINLLMRKDSAL